MVVVGRGKLMLDEVEYFFGFIDFLEEGCELLLFSLVHV